MIASTRCRSQFGNGLGVRPGGCAQRGEDGGEVVQGWPGAGSEAGGSLEQVRLAAVPGVVGADVYGDQQHVAAAGVQEDDGGGEL